MCLHAKLPLIEVKKTVFDDALALEMTVGKETWEPTPNLAMQRLQGAFLKFAPSRAKQRSKLAYESKRH